MADAAPDAVLHLTKVAVGCPDIETLARRQRERWSGDLCHLTRFMPKQAQALIGGSLFWIIKHRLVARQPITGFAMVETEWGPKCRIGLGSAPVPVDPVSKRAHQGWRYLAADEAPPDLGWTTSDAMPAAMVRELQALWLM